MLGCVIFIDPGEIFRQDHSMKTFLGIDGGGTHTRAVLVNESGKILGRGDAGSCNYHNLGLELATANLRQATERAAKAAGIPYGSVCSAFIGSAGIKSSRDKSQLRAAAETAGLAPAGEIVVENDLHNALAGGLSGRPGIALIAGTGSNCLGRDASGQAFMCGGWGWLLDDGGSAFGLTAAGLRAAVRAADGRAEPTRLLPALLAFLGLSEPDELSARLYVDKWTPNELADFAPALIRVASDGDRAAQQILCEGANALAELVRGTLRALSFADKVPVVLLGGCARSGAPYQPLIESALRNLSPSLCLLEPEGDTVAGAALNALRSGGVFPLPPLT